MLTNLSSAQQRAKRMVVFALIPFLAMCTSSDMPTAADPGTANLPGTVTDLVVASITSSMATLTFTQVSDGASQPAKYDIRYRISPITWGNAASATQGTCATPVAGTTIGSKLTCTVQGLSPATKYDFQLVAFRGALNANATIGTTSNIASATTSGTANQPPAPIGDSEPVFTNSASQHLIFRDDFDSYSSFADAVTGGWRSANGGVTQDVTTNASGANLVISPGYDGTGHAIRLVYDGKANCATQECHAWGRPTMNGDNVVGMAGKTFYMSFYARINAGGGARLDQDANHIVKVKWLELWNTSDRAQFSTSYSTCVNDVPFAGANGSGTMWDFYGRAAGTTKCNAGQVRGPFAYQAAGQWHRVTYKYVSQSASGARDGVAQMWYDGTLVLSVSAPFCGVRVPNQPSTGMQTWCDTTDLDNFFVNSAITHLTLGSVMTGSLWPFTIDYDHMIVWRDP